MSLQRLVMSKRLVMGAALAFFGCADANTGGVEVPPFSSPNEPPDTTGAQAANEAAESPQAAEDSAEETGSPPAPGETGASGSEPGNPTPASEGQNTNNLPIAPANAGGGAAPAAAPPSNPAGTPPGSNGMAAGTGQAANGMGNGTPAAAPPPAPPPPRPPLDCAAPAPALNGGTMSCSVNASGRVDGQSWFMWYSGTGGCMTTYDRAAFKATWNNSGDFLARMGLQFDETKTFDQYGALGADLAFTKTGSAGGYSFIGIYGWSNNPLVEYYIVENSFGNGPATPYATTQRGTFNVDGASYKVYSGTKTNQPSIHGTANFQQFFSVRQTPRQCGHVSISDHFKQWASMGMNLGKMYEARILVEAGGGSGSINFTSAYVTAGGN